MHYMLCQWMPMVMVKGVDDYSNVAFIVIVIIVKTSCSDVSEARRVVSISPDVDGGLISGLFFLLVLGRRPTSIDKNYNIKHLNLNSFVLTKLFQTRRGQLRIVFIYYLLF